jgi:LTXXQ motif family protein
MRMTSYVLAGGIALASLARTPASAELPLWGGPPSPAAMFQKLCKDEDALFKAKVAFIEAKLGIEPKQRQSWETFVAEVAAAGQPIRSVCKEIPPATDGDVVASLDLHQRTLGAFLETHRGVTAAAKKLVAGLPAEQQRALAESIMHPLLAPPIFVPPFPPF